MGKIETLIKKIFDTDRVYPLSRLLGGMMNESTILIDERTTTKYVLYMPTKQSSGMVDRVLERDNQAIVIDLGLTSKNYYFDTKTGIKVNEYIEGSSLNQIDDELIDIKKVANLLKKLHKSPKLSKIDYFPFEKLEMYIQERNALKIKFDKAHDTLYKYILSNKKIMIDCPIVLSHNDFQKSNIIKSNKNKYYMIDFEFMMNNYEMYDIACYGNGDVQDGVKLLEAYYGKKINTNLYFKYYLWRIFVSLQWYNVALIKQANGESEIHHIDFLSVAHHFLENAIEAKRQIDILLAKK